MAQRYPNMAKTLQQRFNHANNKLKPGGPRMSGPMGGNMPGMRPPFPGGNMPPRPNMMGPGGAMDGSGPDGNPVPSDSDCPTSDSGPPLSGKQILPSLTF